jgi:SpoIIAA-like
MEQQSFEEWTVGTHQVRWEPPDLLKITWRGTAHDEQVDVLARHMEAVPAPRYWVLTDISQSDIPSASVRARLAKTKLMLRICGVAVVVSSRYKRAVIDMLVRAMNLLTGTRVNVAFFENEKDARVWIAAEKQRLAGTNQ